MILCWSTCIALRAGGANGAAATSGYCRSPRARLTVHQLASRGQRNYLRAGPLSIVGPYRLLVESLRVYIYPHHFLSVVSRMGPHSSRAARVRVSGCRARSSTAVAASSWSSALSRRTAFGTSTDDKTTAAYAGPDSSGFSISSTAISPGLS